ncbi:maleylpyruvate isomerase family mycothiol-dependent enzyme [Streptomyces sp. NBC_00654]|uniref:maleylpyruvate isomerase family mycothiol-dependent enzyme n=1 Tax=Streptomyces sp. NBC_00654 TaxID=2975799 RepID=UPI0022599103|nr:maleylpyruvate isomerase family mycothiol-dependent enzyme [Streptomyces sp. NBC_00654]MCX4969029.1 maleylpyruvate isomerase family mycothiol-dependent enzyme [Streptomyces sp. NBC_00654]
MTSLTYDRYCDEILAQTDELRALLKGADLAARVPTCPDWSLRELALHVGGAHRWVGEIVRSRATEDIPAGKVPGAEGPDDDDSAALDAWLAEGTAGAVAALREAGPGTEVWAWGWERRTDFWVRRMTHETVVHRADAALAAGTVFEVAPEVAADTIDEWLRIVAFSQAGGDPEAAGLCGGGRSLHLHATDAPGAEWLIEFGEDRFTWRRAHERATVALRGSLTDVMLVFNRRLDPGSDRVEVLGDAELLDFWLERSSFG